MTIGKYNMASHIALAIGNCIAIPNTCFEKLYNNLFYNDNIIIIQNTIDI